MARHKTTRSVAKRKTKRADRTSLILGLSGLTVFLGIATLVFILLPFDGPIGDILFGVGFAISSIIDVSQRPAR